MDPPSSIRIDHVLVVLEYVILMFTMFKVIFGMVFICFLGGLFFYTIFDLKPWRKDSQLWDPKRGLLSTYLRFKKFAQQNFSSRIIWSYIKEYYPFLLSGLALIMVIAISFSD